MATKHEQILAYIESIPVGTRLSVRGIARKLGVSEGTAYRAMKEAELTGLVSSMERIGTVRIERKKKENIERLTFAEVVNIVDGTVLGGRDGLHKTLQKLVIGAMQVEAIVRYIEPGSLMIVGNREQVQKLSLEHGAGVLITGGFEASEDVQQLANQQQLPIISSSYDTFTTATMINRAIYDRLIKKDILYVEDIVPRQEPVVLIKHQTIRDYLNIVEHTGHTRIPVVDEDRRLVGMLTSVDVAEARPEDSVDQHMVKHLVTVTLKTTVASAAHRMVWEGVELLPVIQQRRLVAVLSRQDVLKALQLMNRQPQIGETLEDINVQGFTEIRNEDKSVSFVGEVTPQMTSAIGTLALGSLTSLIENAAFLSLGRSRNSDMVIENLTIYSLNPISVDTRVEVRARLLDHGRRFAKVDVEVYGGDEKAAKALVTVQMLER